MSFLAELAGSLLGGGNSSRIFESVAGMLTNPQTGGIGGLIDAFKDKGLGELIGSWVGTGQNMPVSTDQIIDVIGRDRIDELAQQAGLPADQLTGLIAQYLPQLIDKISPDGQVPDADALSTALGELKTKLGV